MNWRENEVFIKLIYIIGGGICSSAYSSTCFYKETLTVGTTTSAGISTAAKDADLRFWYDGNNPTTNTGHLLLKNNFISIEGGWLGALHFATNPGANSHTITPRMTIRDDKVGIGTTTPQTILHVIGTLTVSSGIIVAGSTMTVPDYVFDESYKLMPLDELKEYIEINKHLPAFKSNIKDLNLVADNMALRKTIEELTLYILQIKNEINLLKLRY